MTTEIKTISLEDAFILSTAAKRTGWTVLKIDPNTIRVSPTLLQEVKELSDKLEFIKKDPGTYGESYEGISIQYSNRDCDTDYRKNYASVAAKAKINRYDPYLKRTIYYDNDEKHGPGFLLDDPSTSKTKTWVNLENRPDLQTIIEVAKSKDSITSYLFLNSWANVFKDLILQFADKNMILYFGRLLRTIPGQVSAIHSDGDVRMHVPIYTNDRCITTYYNDKGDIIGTYHMPADGSVYLFNGHPLHEFHNSGTTSRLHAIFAIATTACNFSSSSWKQEFASVDQVLQAQKQQLHNLGN